MSPSLALLAALLVLVVFRHMEVHHHQAELSARDVDFPRVSEPWDRDISFRGRVGLTQAEVSARRVAPKSIFPKDLWGEEILSPG